MEKAKDHDKTNGIISPAQVAGARGMLGITQAELAERAHVGLSTVRNYEAGRTVRKGPRGLIQREIERGGILPIGADAWGGEGVRFRK